MPGIHGFFCGRHRRSWPGLPCDQSSALTTHSETRADIGVPERYINPPGTSGLLAFGLESEQ
jgi:hypothetical protein